MRAARSLANGTAVPSRSARRSGTLAITPRRATGGVVLAECPTEQRANLSALIATIGGIAAFPLAGLALLGHALSPLSFAVFAAFVGCLVFVSLARLEPF
jgi:hypothetical protein